MKTTSYLTIEKTQTQHQNPFESIEFNSFGMVLKEQDHASMPRSGAHGSFQEHAQVPYRSRYQLGPASVLRKQQHMG